MTASDDTFTPLRRTVLRTLGAVGASAGLLSSGTLAADDRTSEASGGRESLPQEPLFFTVYAGAGADPVAFGFPDSPALSGFDPNGSFFDSSTIEKTPNGQTLHYGFRFLPSSPIVGEPKPYVLTHEEDGRYVSRGQNVNFELDGPAPSPFEALDAGKWRAVAKDVVKLDEKGGAVEWAVTRVDFYDRQGNTYAFSLAYALWSPDFSPVSRENLRTPERELPSVVEAEATALVEGGLL